MSLFKKLFGKSKRRKVDKNRENTPTTYRICEDKSHANGHNENNQKIRGLDPNRKSQQKECLPPIRNGHTVLRDEKFFDSKVSPQTFPETVKKEKDWEVKRLPVWKFGDVISGKYGVRGVKKGGMARVYIVFQKKWNRIVAIKAPNEMMLSEKDLYARIIREATSWIGLGLHPNIVHCYYVTNIEGVPHIVVEYVDGGNLRQWIEDGKCIDYRTNLDLAIQFCHGM